MLNLNGFTSADLFDVLMTLALYALLCWAWWWALTDWRKDNRAPETRGYPEKPPRNPFLWCREPTEHERDTSSW